jgi:hypothetical protein
MVDPMYDKSIDFDRHVCHTVLRGADIEADVATEDNHVNYSTADRTEQIVLLI